MGTIYLTPEGYEKIRKELEFLKNSRRREISKEIGKAREHGDISENAEYDAAKEAQALNEKRIAELEEKLSRGQILDQSAIPKDEALMGATVALKDMDSGEKLEYTLVSELEGDFSQGKISADSPVGKGLLGHKKGDIVKIRVPAGTLRYKILKITRLAILLLLLKTIPQNAFAEGLSTLAEVAKSQKEIQKLGDKETEAFGAVKEALETGELKKGESQDFIRRQYGEPLVVLTQENGSEKWVYKPAYASFFNGVKIYLFFDTNRTLTGIKLLNSGR